MCVCVCVCARARACVRAPTVPSGLSAHQREGGIVVVVIEQLGAGEGVAM